MLMMIHRKENREIIKKIREIIIDCMKIKYQRAVTKVKENKEPSWRTSFYTLGEDCNNKKD